jgi:hypothetical protein
MALITIKDLPQSDELDRKAMHAIVGGARSAGGRLAGLAATAAAPSARIVDYPPGFARDLAALAGGKRPTP